MSLDITTYPYLGLSLIKITGDNLPEARELLAYQMKDCQPDVGTETLSGIRIGDVLVRTIHDRDWHLSALNDLTSTILKWYRDACITGTTKNRLTS